MRNLQLGGKIGLVIAVQIVIMLCLVFINFRQLALLHAQLTRTYESTIPKGGGVLRLRNALLDSIRLLDLAVFSDSDRDSERFVKRSQEAVDNLLQQKKTLADLIAKEGNPEEKASIDELTPALTRFLRLHREIGELAVINTNTKAHRLLETAGAAKLKELQDAIDTLLLQQDKEFIRAEMEKTGPRLLLLQRRSTLLAAVASSVQELYRLLTTHLSSASREGGAEQKTVLETQRKALDKEIDGKLREVEAGLDERDRVVFDRAALNRIRTMLAEFRDVAERVESLSRQNSYPRAVQLTLGEAAQINETVNDILNRIRDLYAERISMERAAGAEGFYLARGIMISSTIIGTVVSIGLSLLLTRSITQPLQSAAQLAKDMASGDLTRRLGLDQKDEVGQLGHAMDSVAAALARVVTDIRGVSGQVANSAHGLSGLSTQLLTGSQEIALQASTAATASEEMAMNINTMAAASEEMSMNVASISSASEEMSVNISTISSAAEQTSHNVTNVSSSIQAMSQSFRDISQDALAGSAVAGQAMDLATGATHSMKTLDHSASEINKVTEMIKMIALQTNLLALNATIEATSAGEAGKGFAVVASEIKELANQSGRAAEDIARKIEVMQTSTREAVAVIQNVASIIQDINTSAGRISRSVELQTDNAGTISRNIREASKGVGDIARSIAEVAKGASDMSRNAGDAASGATDMSRNASEAARAGKAISHSIQTLDKATGTNTTSAGRVQSEAHDLTRIAAELQRLVGHFRVEN